MNISLDMINRRLQYSKGNDLSQETSINTHEMQIDTQTIKTIKETIKSHNQISLSVTQIVYRT